MNTKIERFVNSYRALVALVREAIQHAGADVALPNLEKELQCIEEAAARFLIGAPSDIVECARDAVHLAKNLDWCCSANFAGPEYAKKLDAAVTAVVLTAYQVEVG